MQLANDLDAQAQVLRAHASAVMASGRPIDVPWPYGPGTKSLHQLTSLDILADAEALGADAVKVRTLYN